MSFLDRLSPQLVMVFAYFAYATSDLGIKMTAGFLKTFEVVFLRSCFAILIVGFIYKKNIWEFLKPIRLGEFFLSLISFVSILCAVESLKNISLSTFAILNLSIPIFSMLLSGIFLQEKLDFQKALSLLLGLIGGIFVVFKGGMEVNVGIIWGLVSAFLLAITYILIKKSKASRESLFLSYLIVCFVGTILIVDLGNLSYVFKNNHVWWLCLSSVAQLLAFYAILSGVQRADLGQIIHLEYTTVIFCGLYSFIFFNTHPTFFEILGSLLIFSGILLKTPQKQNLKKALGD